MGGIILRKYLYEDHVRIMREIKHQTTPYTFSPPLGINEKGSLEWIDLSNNTLITGGSGCGRGDLLYGLVYSIITLYSHAEAQLWLYDSELHSFDWISEYKVPHVAYCISEESKEATAAFVNALTAETQKRYDILFSSGFHSFEEYCAATGEVHVSHATVIIDFSELFFKHLWELPEEYRRKFSWILLFSKALNISVTMCSAEFKYFLWGDNIYPYFFPQRIAMVQPPHSVNRTMECDVATEIRPIKRTDLCINQPILHKLTSLTLYNTVVESSLSMRFGLSSYAEISTSDD